MSMNMRPTTQPQGNDPSEMLSGKRVLQRLLPQNWRFAQQTTADLLSRMNHLAWHDRTDVMDGFFSRQAEGMLGATGVTALVGGQFNTPAKGVSFASPDGNRAAEYSRWCRAVCTATVLDLKEDTAVKDPHQALSYLLSRDWRFAKAAAAWVAIHGMTPIAETLGGLPGHALVLLATSPNDTVERFLARDAFWQAVHSQD